MWSKTDAGVKNEVILTLEKFRVCSWVRSDFITEMTNQSIMHKAIVKNSRIMLHATAATSPMSGLGA